MGIPIHIFFFNKHKQTFFLNTTLISSFLTINHTSCFIFLYIPSIHQLTLIFNLFPDLFIITITIIVIVSRFDDKL